ncbi:hypothetical protein Tco_1444866, partial [Tanacetum coccineum]
CLSLKTTAWNEFGSTTTSAIIYLATNQKFNFSKLIFDIMVRNLDDLSGSGPRRQDIMRDIIAQTRFKNISTPSYDPLLIRGNTLQSGEDSLKLKELMELCTNLQQRVLDLEKTKTIQAAEIVILKRRVKKLKQKKRSRTQGLKRLRKIGVTARVVSSEEEEVLGEDASKQGRNDNVDTMNNSQNVDEQMFDVNDLAALRSAKPKVKGDVIEEPSVPVSVVNALTKVIAAITITTIILTQRKGIVITELGIPTITRSSQQPSQAIVQDKGILAKIKADHELAKRLQAEEQEQFIIDQKATLFKEILEQRRKHFAAKRVEEKRNKPPTQAQQRKSCKMFNRAFKMVNRFVDLKTDLVEGSSKRAREDLQQESNKKQKVDEDKDTIELQSLMEVILDNEEVAIDVVPLATKPPTIID